MKLKNCTGCKAPQTTKTAAFLGRDVVALYFNCKKCDSTFMMRSKNWKEKLDQEPFNQTLDEVITRVLTMTPIPAKDLIGSIRKDLSKYFSQEVQRYEASLTKSLSNDLKVLGAQELFDRVFRGN